MQTVFDVLASGDYADVVRNIGSAAEAFTDIIDEGRKNVLDNAKKLAGEAEQTIQRYWKDGAVREFIQQYGVSYERFKHPEFRDYQIRVTEPKLCDPDVQQYSGYLDVTDGKHLFFWFFESRTYPETAPLILWLNGGPGCSSSTGLLFELGPCRIANDGLNITYNPHSWNTHANIIFLDQPVNVGYSYSDDGSSVNTSPAAGEDVLAFLQLFLTRFPKYADAPFHIAAESYGGTYAPNFASIIHKHNKALELSPKENVVKINLASIMIGNGMTDRYIQDASIPTFACEGPFPIYDDPNGPECQALRGKVPTCQRLINACYKYNSRLACVPAGIYCNAQLYGPIQQSGKNPYDVRKTCDPEKDTSLCYKQMGWIETWMNEEQNKLDVGAHPDVEFASCNFQVNQAFMLQGDSTHNSALLLTDLVNDGVRVLIYAGNADYMCNFIGNEAWLEAMGSKFHDAFAASEAQPWITLSGGKIAGTVRTAGANEFTAGNVTFVTVYDAGHMVPFDQPEAALDLITRWIFDAPLGN
ncbi:serine carboxypeptidase [Fomitiporia mediterranea MF3/22]|uniref:serine carboxypeptidase n=1 Tax=Fomitiporia mediterranea (strain MF3/22) TaxID=694068 RepID=UPI00044077EF|nr:serine carboxypeptidase [Fomitiporia mediterranea MF3/22]EJD05531.1 serine carboxypeptidase [Fomitiporia mediterranea MF3/22]